MKLSFASMALFLCLSIEGQTATTYHGAPYTGNPPNAPFMVVWNTPVYDPVSRCVIGYLDRVGSTIYSNAFFAWNPVGLCNSLPSYQIGNDGITGGETCAADSPTFPGSRHPNQQMVADTKRNRIWLYQGPCQFGPALLDLYYLSLNANPASNTFTRATDPVHPARSGYDGAGTYDSYHDVIIQFGYDNNASTPVTEVLCFGATPTARQASVGCVNGDDWNTVLVGGTQPPGVVQEALVFDTVNRVAIAFGGYLAGPSTPQNELWTYDPEAKAWTHRTPTNGPPAPNPTGGGAAIIGTPMALNPKDGYIYYLATKASPDLYKWRFGDAAWTLICSNCGGTPAQNAFAMAVAPDRNVLVVYAFGGSLPVNTNDLAIVEIQFQGGASYSGKGIPSGNTSF